MTDGRPEILIIGARASFAGPQVSHARLQGQANREAMQTGAVASPVDVGTTGNTSGYVPQPETTAPNEWAQNSYAQVEGGFLGGLALGAVPFAGVGHQLLDAGGVLPHGSTEARRGVAVGQIFGGIVTLAGGLTGEVLGGITSVTGIGGAIGVPAMGVSTGLVVGGVGNIAAGIRGLLTTGSGSSGTQVMASDAEGEALKPEAGYLGSKKHGIGWKEGPATAKNLQKPQGQWGGKADLDFAAKKAATLKPGEGQFFDLPEGHSSVVHRPDGTTVR